MMWTQKHKPKNLKELVVHKDTVSRFTKFVENHDKEKKKALLLWGEIGIGKTLLPTIYSKEKGYDLTELNASTQRSKKVIQESLKNMVTTASLFGNKKIILIDEVDCMGRSDHGGLRAIIEAIKITKFPIILTAQDYWNTKLSKLRKHVLGLETKPASAETRLEFAEKILKKEKTFYELGALKKLMTSTDLRGVINDLQTLHNAGGVTTKNMGAVGYRNRKQELKTMIHRTLTSKSFADSLKELSSTEDDLRNITTWMNENLPYYSARKNHYELLSASDVFNGRIMRRQYWRMAYYQRLLMAGINSLEGKSVKYPEIIRRMFITRSKRAKKDSVTEKLGAYLHTSKNKTGKYYLNWVGRLGEQLEQLELDKEEINYLKSL